ncbi:MAG: hypothetical protein P8X74_03690 [Reinekea sp.]
MNTWTDEQVINKANELAKIFYALRGYIVPDGYRFDKATHPHEKEAWAQSVAAFEFLRDTDVDDALSNVEDDDGDTTKQ